MFILMLILKGFFAHMYVYEISLELMNTFLGVHFNQCLALPDLFKSCKLRSVGFFCCFSKALKTISTTEKCALQCAVFSC